MNGNNFVSSLPDHVYYTLSFRNNGVNGEAEDAIVDYLEVRNNPYLQTPDLYSCSIIRFSLTTPTLPIFIPQMYPGFTSTGSTSAPEYQQTIYSFTMTYGSTNVRKFVKYIPQTQNLQPSLTVDDALVNPYYYVYQAAQFVVMLNNALVECFEEIFPTTVTPVQRFPVYLNWIDNASRAIFYAPQELCQEPNYASQPTTYPTLTFATIAGPGTVGSITGAGTIASPWTATVTGLTSTAGLYVSGTVTATTGTGSLYGGVPTSVVITAVVLNSSFTYEVIGGTTPTAGTVTNIVPSSALQLQVWANTALFNLLSSFQAEKVPFSYANQQNDLGKHFRFQWWNLYNSIEQTANTFVPPNLLNRNTTPPAPPNSAPYIAINESYSVVPLWNPVKSIVFTTALLPVLPELVSAAQSVGVSTSFSNSGNNANVQNVLTDFEVQLETGEETRPVVYYVPTAEYRMVDLQSNQPLCGIQLSVNWRNKFGSLIPLKLGTDGNAQIKILFRKRDWSS